MQSADSLDVQYKLGIVVLFAVLRRKKQNVPCTNDDKLLLPLKLGSRFVWNRQPALQTMFYTSYQSTCLTSHSTRYRRQS